MFDPPVGRTAFREVVRHAVRTGLERVVAPDPTCGNAEGHLDARQRRRADGRENSLSQARRSRGQEVTEQGMAQCQRADIHAVVEGYRGQVIKMRREVVTEGGVRASEERLTGLCCGRAATPVVGLPAPAVEGLVLAQEWDIREQEGSASDRRVVWLSSRTSSRAIPSYPVGSSAIYTRWGGRPKRSYRKDGVQSAYGRTRIANGRFVAVVRPAGVGHNRPVATFTQSGLSATTGRSPHSPKAVSHTPDLPEPTGRARWSPKDRRRAWLGSPLKRSQCCRAPVAPRQRASPNGTETTVLQPEPLAGGVSPNCMVPRANRRNSQLRMGSPVLRSAT